MSDGNKQFAIAVASMIGINILINVLPSPWGMFAFFGIMGYFLWDLYKNTRY